MSEYYFAIRYHDKGGPNTLVQKVTYPPMTRPGTQMLAPADWMPLVQAAAIILGTSIMAISIWKADDGGGELYQHLPYRNNESVVRHPSNKDGGFYLSPTSSNPNIMV